MKLQLLGVVTWLLLLAWQSASAQTSSSSSPSSPAASNLGRWGQFIGRVYEHKPHPDDPDYIPGPKWGPDQRVLDQDFAYKDPASEVWKARKGQHIDGASIPALFWNYCIGTPFTGTYFEGSVIHDAYCENPAGHSYLQVHQMFYNAMRCGGTKSFEAGTKYWAVLKFGPPNDRSVFDRAFRKPTKRVGQPEMSLAAAWLSDEVLPVADDASRARFFAALEPVAPDQSDSKAVTYLAPTSSTVALAQVAVQRGLIKAVTVERDWGAPEFSATATYPNASASASPKPSANAYPQNTPSAYENYSLQVGFAPSVYRVTHDPIEKQALDAVIYIAKQHERLQPSDIERLAREGIPKRTDSQTKPAGHER